MKTSFVDAESFDPKRFTELADKILASTQRISKIVHGLRVLSRSDTNDMELFDLVLAMRQSVEIVREIYRRSGIEIRLKHPHDAVPIRGNKGRIQQVFMNLLSNARDATVGQPVRQRQRGHQNSARKRW